MERLSGRIILLWGWRRALAAFAAGALLVLTQPPFDFFAAGFFAFPVLVWLIDGVAAASLRARLAGAFAIGWWFGFGYFFGGLWWIGNAVLVDGDAFAWALPFASAGIPAVLALFHGLATAVARLFWGRGIGRIAALVFGFGLAEWLRGFLLSGFPWNPIGAAAMPIPLLMQSVVLVGLVGMNVLAVLVFAMPALLAARGEGRAGAVLALVLMAAHAGFGWWRLSLPEPSDMRMLPVRVVQPAIDLTEKWDAGVRDRVFAVTLDLSRAPPADPAARPELIVWPETSVPFLFSDRPDALASIGASLEPGQRLLAGAVRSETASADAAEPRYYNSVVAIDDAGVIADAVDKVHLVPFGEYIPFAALFERFGVSQLVAGPMNFVAGSNRSAIALPGGLTAMPFVCYEVIFPDLVSSAHEADILVNVTNDSWFGDTPGPYQHFRQAQLRAVENAKPLIRAANDGISGVIDWRGRVVDALALGKRGYADIMVGVPANRPPYMAGSALRGLILVFFVGLWGAGVAIQGRGKGLGRRKYGNT